MYLRTLLFLVAAHAAAGAIVNDTSVTVVPRTFIRWHEEVTDEPIDYTSDTSDDVRENTSRLLRGPIRDTSDDVQKNNTSRLLRGPSTQSKPDQENQQLKVRRRYYLSEETTAFLSSHVSTIFIPLLYTFVFLVSVPLNAIALVTFAWKVRPMKPAVIFMMNLASADLLFALLLPFKMAYHFSGNDWTFGPGMCSLVTAAFYCNMYCSVLLITCISVDRLLAVVYPIKSLSWRKPRNAAIACATMWALAVGASLPLLLSKQAFYQEELKITTCHDVLDLDELQGSYLYFFPTFSCVLFFLPLIVTVMSYCWVIWTLSVVPQGVVGRSRRKRRALVMALTVLVVFVICFTPTNSLLMAHYLQFARGDQAAAAEGLYGLYLVSLCVASVNCCLDPVLYYFGSSQCQRQIAGMLSCRAGVEGGRSLLSSGSSRSSTRNSTRAGTHTINKVFLDSLSSQHKKLLV